jgi:hypothetical protein
MMACLEMMMLLIGAAIGCAVALVVVWARERAERKRRAAFVRRYLPMALTLHALNEGVVPVRDTLACIDMDFSELYLNGIGLNGGSVSVFRAVQRFSAWVEYAPLEAKQGYPAVGYRAVGLPFHWFDYEGGCCPASPVRCTVTEAGIKYIGG